MIFVFTGNGKGKTTAAIGCAIRAIGNGKDVAIVQFMKNRKTGEREFFQKIGIPFYQFGRETFVTSVMEEDKEYAIAGIEKARELTSYFLLVLDEINVACHFGLLRKEDVLNLISYAKGREDKHVILTGRYAPEEFIEVADLVTEMKEVKHYKRAIFGIEW